MSPFKKFNTRCQGKNELAKCIALMDNITAARKHAIMYFKQYVKSYQECVNTMEALRNSLRCASCDSENMYLINDHEKIVYLNRSSMNKIIKSCYNYSLYRANLTKELYTAYLNYAKQVDPTILLQNTEFDTMFNDKVKDCSNWLEFTRTNYSGDLTMSRECINYGLSIINHTLPDTKDLTFTRVYWKFTLQIANTLATRKTANILMNYLPGKMRPLDHNRILSEVPLTPIQKAMLIKENESMKGYKVDISDIETKWKFQVHPNPERGLDLAIYDKDSNIKKFDIEKMFQNKEVQADILKINQ